MMETVEMFLRVRPRSQSPRASKRARGLQSAQHPRAGKCQDLGSAGFLEAAAPMARRCQLGGRLDAEECKAPASVINVSAKGGC